MNPQQLQIGQEIHAGMLRAARYCNIEGSVELGLGSMLVFFSLCAFEPHWFPRGSAWTGALGFVLLAAGGLSPLIIPKLIKRLVTWPRTGYVAYRRNRSWWIGLVGGSVIGGAGGALLAAYFAHSSHHAAHSANPPAALLPGSGFDTGLTIFVILCYSLLYLMSNAVSIREHHWKWCILAAILVGSMWLGLWLPGDYQHRFPPIGLFMGVLTLVSGLLTLASYLSHNHPAPQDEP